MKSKLRVLISLLPETLERKMYEKYFEREHKQWIDNGGNYPASNLSKQTMLKRAQEESGITNLVETGTYLGDTLYSLSPYFERLYSIELSDFYYKKAKSRFSKNNKVKLLKGDSGDVLKELVPQLKKASMFWLDGHYSGGLTAKGKKDCPIFEELEAIFASPHSHQIFIDDARLFVGQNDYPTLADLRGFLAKHRPGYSMVVENDCIKLVPTGT